MKALFYGLMTLFIIISSPQLFSSASLEIGKRHYSALDKMPFHSVRDLRTLPQDTTWFTQQLKPFTRQEQKRYDRIYNRKFFKPWHQKWMGLTKKERQWQFSFARQKSYNRWGYRISKKWWRKLLKNYNYKAYGRLRRSGITVKHTDLKSYPTTRDFYYNPKRSGEGFPFDYNQNSSLNLNTPLIVSHYSKDKKWVFVRTAYAYGWIDVSSMAFVGRSFKKKFENNNYAISVKDNLFLKRDGLLSSLVKLGTIFPIDKKRKKYIVARRNKLGYAQIEFVDIKDKWILAKKPLAFTPQNVAFVSKQMVGEPYGWGGKLQARDCSSLTRDCLAPFGIFLRRNSKEQRYDGRYVSLKGLSIASKKRKILKYAKPFRSLLYVPGHIVMYLGEKNGEPIILHNYWGVRLKNRRKYILGKGIITTTMPGIELKNIRKRSMLIHTLQGIINF